MIYIDMDEKVGGLVPTDLLQDAAHRTLQQTGLKEIPSLTLKITGDQQIQELNAAYRGVDKATDVLAFEADYYDPDLESHYLGDVVISFPRAAEQAKKRGHPVESELQLLVIHGVLHLLGFDHGSIEEKQAMWKVQGQILQALGLDIVVEDNE